MASPHSTRVVISGRVDHWGGLGLLLHRMTRVLQGRCWRRPTFLAYPRAWVSPAHLARYVGVRLTAESLQPPPCPLPRRVGKRLPLEAPGSGAAPPVDDTGLAFVAADGLVLPTGCA